MVEMSEVLMERKADYNQSHDKASRGMIKDSVLNHKPLLNGDFDFLGRQQRSSSECSSDSQVDTLLEEADKIQTSKNGFNRKGVKKQVRFNMERNREHCYSYAQSSDDESLMNNVNFMDHNFHHSERYDDENDSGSGDDNDEDDDRDSDDDDDDDDDDDSQSTDDEEEREGAHNQHDTDLSEENSTLGKFGHLVDKSGPPLEINNSEESNSILKPTRLLVNGVNDTAEGSLANGLNGHCEAHMNDELLQDRTLVHLRAKVVEMESSLRAKQDSAQREMEDMSTRLQRERENTTQEMNKLQKELEDRRRQYLTEMQDIDRQREEQKKKFEEELEEFRNEKKLEERRQRYYEHEATISQMEKELDDRAQEVRERDKEIREYEEYLNRRHAVCTNKEQDLNVLQSELEILASELEAKKTKLLNRQQLVHQSSEEDTVPSTPPLLKARSASRMSIVGKGGVDLRIEELKSQNKQLLEELFSLRKACESKDEDLTELREKLGVSESENKRLQQRTKHLETQLELARKTAEIGADSISVDEIMRKTSQDMRKNSRMIRPSRAVAPLSSSGSSSGMKLVRVSSIDSVGTKNTSSSDTEKGTKASDVKAVKLTAGKKGKDDCGGRHKLGTEKITSSLCTVM